MGNSSSFLLSTSDDTSHWLSYKYLMETFKFTQDEFELLYNSFLSVESNLKNGSKSDAVRITDLADTFGFSNDEYLYRCFSAFDATHSGNINFGEFFCALWNYCTNTPEQHIIQAFHLFDVGGNNYIPLETVWTLLRELYGHGGNTSEVLWNSIEDVVLALDKSDFNWDCDVDIDMFSTLVGENYELFTRAFPRNEQFIGNFWNSIFWEIKSANTIIVEASHELSIAEFKAQSTQHFKKLLRWREVLHIPQLIRARTRSRKSAKAKPMRFPLIGPVPAPTDEELVGKFNSLKAMVSSGMSKKSSKSAKKVVPIERSASDATSIQDPFSRTQSNNTVHRMSSAGTNDGLFSRASSNPNTEFPCSLSSPGCGMVCADSVTGLSTLVVGDKLLYQSSSEKPKRCSSLDVVVDTDRMSTSRLQVEVISRHLSNAKSEGSVISRHSSIETTFNQQVGGGTRRNISR